MQLREVLPPEFLSGEYDDTRAFKMRDVFAIRTVDAREQPWPGSHKFVNYWYPLTNGYAVGWNENPQKGWSFPVIKFDYPVISKQKDLPQL
jgi:hypothetical protein